MYIYLQSGLLQVVSVSTLDWSITWSLYDGVSTRHCTGTGTGVTNIYQGARHLTCIISAKLAYYRPIIALVNYE